MTVLYLGIRISAPAETGEKPFLQMGNGCRRPATIATMATGSDARAPTHRFEFEINGQKYSLDTKRFLNKRFLCEYVV